jgi:stage II sporulation protein D
MEIRVRLSEQVSHFRIRGFDLRFHQVLKSEVKRVGAFDKKTEWEIDCQSKTIQVRLSQPNSKTSVYRGIEKLVVDSPAGFLHYQQHPYRGELSLYPGPKGCEVVNTVDLEKYLEGLVNSEFSSKWNGEAIAAQVVAARTYAWFQMREARKKQAHFDVDSTIRDQVYDGFLKEDYQASHITEKTKGLVLTSQGQSLPIKAFYHSTCGGTTELPERVWGVAYPGFRRKVACPFCHTSPRYSWNLKLSSHEIAEAFLHRDLPQNVQPILEKKQLIEIKTRQNLIDERVLEVVTVWADGKKRFELPISAQRFREWVGTSRVRSTLFQVRSEVGTSGAIQWSFQGRGNGHGVGMCQWGAKVMGEKGHKMASILKYYYPNAILRKLW